MLKKLLNLLNIHLDENQKWTASWLFMCGLVHTYTVPAITKEIVSNLPAEWIAFESLFFSVSSLVVGMMWKGRLRRKAIERFIVLAVAESVCAFLVSMYLVFIGYSVWLFAVATLLYSSLITIFIEKCIMCFRSRLWTEEGRETYDNNNSIISGITCMIGFGLSLLFMPSLTTAICLWGGICLIDNIGWLVVYCKNRKILTGHED